MSPLLPPTAPDHLSGRIIHKSGGSVKVCRVTAARGGQGWQGASR